MIRPAALATCGLLLVAFLGTLHTAQAITCIKRPDGQDLACVTVDTYPHGICVVESLNPPAPFTWQSSTTCQSYIVLS